MMPWLCSLRRENGNITLSCVAGDSGAPCVLRLVALYGGKDSVFANLQLFGGVVLGLFSGSSFFVSHLPILWFGLLFPVAMVTEG